MLPKQSSAVFWSMDPAQATDASMNEEREFNENVFSYFLDCLKT